nr:c-type cytochrome biogenensis protein [Sciadococcus taiwanensis]
MTEKYLCLKSNNLMNKLFQRIINVLIQLNFAISLLLILAMFSVIGTLIEQDQTLSYYQINYANNFLFNVPKWKIISFLGLDHIYRTSWFISLIITLVISLILCSLKTQFPALKLARLLQFKLTTLKSKTINKIEIDFSAIGHKLIQRRYQTIQQGYSIYSYQGIIGKIAPIIVHVSLIIILFGSLLGIFTGFVAQQMLPQGEISHIQNIISSGLFSHISQQTSLKVNQFSIEYYQNGGISQFYTDLTLFNSKLHKLANKVISVNHPLKYKRLTIYQTDWDLAALRVTFDGQNIYELPLNKTKIQDYNIWFCSFPINAKEEITLTLMDIRGDYYIYDNEGKLIQKASFQQPLFIKKKYFQVLGYIPTTGLQIKLDLGLPFVYFGFFLLILSLLLAYLSYNQIWINKNKGYLNLLGEHSRAKLQFHNHIAQISQRE